MSLLFAGHDDDDFAVRCVFLLPRFKYRRAREI